MKVNTAEFIQRSKREVGNHSLLYLIVRDESVGTGFNMYGT